VVTPPGPLEANRGHGVKALVRAAGKALKGDDRHTDTQTINPLYDDDDILSCTGAK